MPTTHMQDRSSAAIESSAGNASFGAMLLPAVTGAVFAWGWLVAALFVGQERAMGDVSQSCMLGGAALALLAFAGLDLAGRRGPELGRAAMRALASLVSATILLFVLTPVGGAVPQAAVNVAWAAYGMVGAYAVRRSFHLLAALAEALDTRQLMRVACGVLALATVLALMAARMSVSEGAVFMLLSATVGIWLLPQGRLALGGAVRGANTGEKSGKGTVAAKRLLPFAFMFVAMGFTCGFHTSVGRVLYSGDNNFGTVFLVILAACWVCATIAKRTRRAGHNVPAVSLQVPLACACVAFVPLLFLSDTPDDLLWETFQDTLVLLSTCALLASIALLVRADSMHHKGSAQPAPFCSVGVAMFALGLFAGWLSGQGAYDAGGSSGAAFHLGVTLCIALLVASILLASNPMAQGVAVIGEVSGEDAEGPDGSEQGGHAKTCAGGQAGETRGGVASAQADDTGGKPASALSADSGETAGKPVPSQSVVAAPPANNTGQAAPAGCMPEPASREEARLDTAVNHVVARYGLSEREHVLLGLLAQGLSAQQAADQLTVSRNTVKSHMAHIYAKCNIHTRSELDELLGTQSNSKDEA